MEIDHERKNKFCMKQYLCASNYKHGDGVISAKFNTAGIQISVNYV
jgi:hypothetical protein